MIRTEAEASPARGAVRTARAVVFAGSAVWLSLSAHVTGGGAAPPVGLILALVVLTSGVTTFLAGRRRGHVSIAVALVSLQVLLHQAFAFLSTASACAGSVSGTMASGTMHHTAADHSRMTMDSMVPACTGPQVADGMPAMGSGMLLAHGLAAIALALLLSHGERVLWTVLTWFLPSLPSRSGFLPVPAVAGPVLLVSSIRPQRGLLSSGVGRRGPPRVLGAPA